LETKYPFVLPEHHSGNTGISVYAFSDIISEELNEDSVVLPGNAVMLANYFLQHSK